MLLGTLTVEVVADTKGVNAGLRSMNTGISKVGSSGVASMAAFGGAVAGVTNQLISMTTRGISSLISGLKELSYESIRLGSSAVEMKNLFGVSFQNMGDEAAAMSAELASSLKVADSTMNRMLGTWGRFAKSAGLSEDHMKTLGKELIIRAGDFASLNDIVGGAQEAMMMFQAAMQGQTKQLRNQGVAISRESASFRTLTKDMMNTHGVTIEVAKALAMQQQIMEKTAISIGDLNRTSGTYANQARFLQENIKSLKEQFGIILIGILQLNKVLMVFNAILRIPGVKLMIAGLIVATMVLIVFTGTIIALVVAIGVMTIALVLQVSVMARGNRVIEAANKHLGKNIALTAKSIAMVGAHTIAMRARNKAFKVLGGAMSNITGVTVTASRAQWAFKESLSIVFDIIKSIPSLIMKAVVSLFTMKISVAALAKSFWGLAVAAWTALLPLLKIAAIVASIAAVGLFLFMVVSRMANALYGAGDGAKTLAEHLTNLKLAFVGIIAVIMELGVSLLDFGKGIVSMLNVAFVAIWGFIKLLAQSFMNFFTYLANAISDIGTGIAMMLTGQEPDFSNLRNGFSAFGKQVAKDAGKYGADISKAFSEIHLGSSEDFELRVGKRILALTGETAADGKATKPTRVESLLETRQAPSALEGSSEAFKIITGAITSDLATKNADANLRTAQNTEDIAVNGIKIQNLSVASMA